MSQQQEAAVSRLMTTEETKAEFSSTAKNHRLHLELLIASSPRPVREMSPLQVTNKQDWTVNRRLSVLRAKLFLEGLGRGGMDSGSQSTGRGLSPSGDR